MQIEEFKEKILKECAKTNLVLNDIQISQFYNYMCLILEWNEKINLTAITDPNDIILKHFIDSIMISKYIKKDANLIDVGTGAGFPGIPVKIIREDINITLIDSLNKRINFLNQVIDKLKLKNINAIHARAEEIGKIQQYREKFDYATSRAVANLSTLSEYLLPFVKENGEAICMKSQDINQEINEGKKAISVLGGKITKIDEFNLSGSDIKRSIIVIKKINKTPLRYPRKAGTPSKEPIK